MHWGLPWPGPEVAAQAEKAGAAAFCAGEFADTNSYLTTGEMVAGTTGAMVGPGIAYAFARSPFVHASALRHLHAKAPGRIFLGLGSGTYRMNTDWFATGADKPVARMADLVGAVRAYLEAENGSTVTHQGDYYPINAAIRAPVLGRLEIPILIGAFNKLMVRTVGRVADGVLGHGLFTDRWWTETISPELVRGAEERGRDAAALRRWGWLITAVDEDDPARARRDARLQIAFYLTVRTYDTLVELHGWQDEVSAIRTAFGVGDIEGMARAVTDEMLDAVALCGTREEARQRLAARQALPDLAFLSSPGFMVGSRRRERYAASAVELMRSVEPG
ncbi:MULTISPECIES: LLM class flavin-dependent oxidoreductase [Streptacidiphilus]|uniref:LLM class flavin-dependent oxidoreductase n=1 Tax=Streptacidiphilus cavernicola TaxID=3342716 RepID=A0ABV6UUQ0_9ACTN|nr:LLM class flavin-dependent oxidoreductase [Streptacidiphilus jeojiense]